MVLKSKNATYMTANAAEELYMIADSFVGCCGCCS